ncbi:MAG TPA: DUF3891 family protein [Symbiobacteriaceae bacterium]|nr:DUF3891 family protein [Symbiobacteriaceae bacterium]
MILHSEGALLRIILQTDHAAFAAELCRRWGGSLFARPEPMASLVTVTERHDEGWLPWQAAPRVDPATGRPWSFTNIPNIYHTSGHAAGVERVKQADAYAGLLLSLHVAGLYKQRYGWMSHMPIPPIPAEYRPAAEAFLTEQERVQAELIALLQPAEASLWAHYRYLQAWDTLSLLICTGWIGEEPGLLGSFPTHPGGPDLALKCWALGGDRYTVSPWPFDVDQFTWAIPARWLPDQPWASDAAFQAALDSAPWGSLPVHMVRSQA